MQRWLRIKLILQTILIALLSVLICLTFITEFYIIKGNKMKPQEYENIYLDYVSVPEYNINNAREQVKRLFNTPHIYIEREIDTLGLSFPLFRVVVINSTIYDEDIYLITYAHELTHIKYATVNETYTEFKSIITLYESRVDYLMAIAWNEVVDVLRGYRSGTDYDCGAQLREYFGV